MKDLFYIDGYLLDKYQVDCIKCNKNLLIVAGAGCGKTSTILGKVKYLINTGYKEDEILCISLTNEATDGLKNKLINIGFNIPCKTFHKLGLDIIKNYNTNINIVDNKLLEYIIDEYFKGIVQYSYRKYLLFFEFKNNNLNYIYLSKEYILLKRNISTFINLLKNKDLDIKFIYYLYKNSIFKHIFFFILEIYRIYEIELKSTNSIDLNDMIIVANRIVREYNIKLKYKYIIIDEFQDSSKIRLNLIQNIIKNNSANIMCVGDDYQSIYRFTGSDIEIFLNFKDYFDNSTIMYLKNTYRNSKELLYVSNKFICKNKFQFKKDLFSTKHNNKPIKIIFCTNRTVGLKKVLRLVNEYMIIGRNNIDIKYYVEKYEDINKYNYYTAHKSKGLESENIILINLTNNVMGFPSKIKNNKIVSKLFDKELYKYDEERRLFYVALTRSKNNVYLLLEKNNISIFVKELINNFREYIEYLNL